MPRRPRQQKSEAAGTSPVPTNCAVTGLTIDQVSHWADLIADGQDGFAEGLSACEEEQLLAVEVGSDCTHRRTRLGSDQIVRSSAIAMVDDDLLGGSGKALPSHPLLLGAGQT